MKSLGEIELELSKLGIRNRFWGKPEVRELAHVLTDDEVIIKAANGRYQGGFALIVATNHRLLLIDKKLWFMSMEDTRFDMITELDFAARLFDATVSVRTINKVMRFTSARQRHLRELTHYLQERILELRQMMMQQQNQMPSQASQPFNVQFDPGQQPPPVQAQPQHFDTSQPQPVQPVTIQPPEPTQLYSQNTNYSRPSRLRRVGAFPTASLTTQHQNYLIARR